MAAGNPRKPSTSSVMPLVLKKFPSSTGNSFDQINVGISSQHHPVPLVDAGALSKKLQPSPALQKPPAEARIKRGCGRDTARVFDAGPTGTNAYSTTGGNIQVEIGATVLLDHD